MKRSNKLILTLMVRNAITIIRKVIIITKSNNKIIPSTKSQILNSSNQLHLPLIINMIILIIIVHTVIPMITSTSLMIIVPTSTISISIMLIALTGILMIMKMKSRRKKKRKNAIMIIQPIIIIIQRYRREISKGLTLITMLIWKVLVKHSQ